MPEPSVDRPRPLLPHIDEPQRGPLMNRFLEPVRTQGIRNPATIVKCVLARLRHDLHERRDWMANDPLRAVFLAVMAHPTEALALAAEAVAHDDLPAGEQVKRKAMRAAEGRRQYMASQPPTDKQIRYLKKLGVTTAPANRWEASQLIDAHVRKESRDA